MIVHTGISISRTPGFKNAVNEFKRLQRTWSRLFHKHLSRIESTHTYSQVGIKTPFYTLWNLCLNSCRQVSFCWQCCHKMNTPFATDMHVQIEASSSNSMEKRITTRRYWSWQKMRSWISSSLFLSMSVPSHLRTQSSAWWVPRSMLNYY